MSDRRDSISRKNEPPPQEWGFAGFTPSGESIYESPQSSRSRNSPQNVPAEIQLPTTTEENEETVQQPPRRSQRTRRSTQREDYIYYQPTTHRGQEEEVTMESQQPISRNSQEPREGDSGEGEREVSTEPQKQEEVLSSRPQSPTPRRKRTSKALLSDCELMSIVKEALDILRVIKDDTYEEFDTPDEEKGEKMKHKESGKNNSKKIFKKSPKRWRKRDPSDSPPGTPSAKKARID
ncbi:unnamed protein product [Hymenolepis diminuta]|uniref:Uncharacterized protein n=1 Tax=Hymenolepis diminuta TaxID=6216 RepID=A0A564YY69_HYMDI|nr:unnamed protein product [Hymenolepis diminuta]